MGSKVFQQDSIHYRYDSPSSPFSPAGQKWDRPIGQVRELTRRFRVLCLTCMLIALGLLGECAIQLNQSIPALWVVERVDGTFVNRVGKLSSNEAQYRALCDHADANNRCVKHAE
jgi:type IV secretory pathway TrbF-like protein